MRSLLRPATFCVVPAMVAVASTARAQAAPDASALRLPVSEAQRPLTLPRLVLAPEIGFDVDHRPNQGAYGDLDASGQFGITDDLMVDALVAPLQLWAPPGNANLVYPNESRVQYGETTRNRGPSVGLTYRFLRGSTEIAGSLTGRVFTVPGLSGGAIIPSLPIRVHATERVRVDVVPTVNVEIATQSPSPGPVIVGGGVPVPSGAAPRTSANAVRVDVPVSALYNLTEAFDVGVTSGLTIYDVNNADATTGIPLGGFLGYTIAGAHGPIADIDPYFTFPYLLMPLRRSSTTDANQYVVGLDVIGYLYL